MNTADRSIALIDIALRRRFFFEELMPNYKKLEEQEKLKEKDFDIDLKTMLKVMNDRIEYLYDRDHTLGHSYFLGVKNLKELMEVFCNKIIPLLQEYFFDDWRKIDMVLGNQAEASLSEKIIANSKLKANNIFREFDHNEFDGEKKLYRINLNKEVTSNFSESKDAWIKAFKYIYEKGNVSG